ncbi:MAG: dTDP-4-dehydrorhamnose 3,5-epimerase family protein [Ilumatobacteraceae bacterium]
MEALEQLIASVITTSIDGVVVLAPTRHVDERGWFVRSLDIAWLGDLGLQTAFVHHNQSRSARGVLRGLHVRGGAGEVKTVRCARGAVVDHVVDTRPWSPTFGRSERFVLDDDSCHHLYLPRFVAHGFQVVSDDGADVCYLHSEPYEPGADLAIAFGDPELALDWPITPAITSDRDATAPRLAEIDLDDLFERS